MYSEVNSSVKKKPKGTLGTILGGIRIQYTGAGEMVQPWL